MEILSASRPSSRIDIYSKEKSTDNAIFQEPVTDEVNVLPRSDGYHRLLLRPFSSVMTDGKKIDDYVKEKNMEGVLDEVKSFQARRELITHDVKQRMSVIKDMFAQHPELKESSSSSVINELAYFALEDLNHESAITYDSVISDLADSGDFTTLSSRDINDKVSDAIDSMSESYLDVFQEAVTKNAEFYKDFSDFMSSLTQFISADGDKTILDGKEFQNALQDKMGKYTVPSMSTTLFPVQNDSENESISLNDDEIKGASLEDCEAWAREFGLSTDDCIRQLDDGTYIVHIDISPLTNINNSVKNENMSFNAAQWSAWQTGIDMQKDHIQNSMQTLTQKFANAHSTFDNLVKILSSTISSLLECDKQFFV